MLPTYSLLPFQPLRSESLLSRVYPAFCNIFMHSLSCLRKCSFVLDFSLDNSPTARAPFEIALLFFLSILWLGKSYSCHHLRIGADARSL